MRSIPTITKNLLIINLLCFGAYFVLGYRGIDLNSIFGLHFFLASKFHFYQLFTYMFMHGNLQHIFFNMFALWMFGCVMERAWGPKKFLFYYILCGIGAGVIQEIVQYFSITYQLTSPSNEIAFTTLFREALKNPSLSNALNAFTTVGASGAIYGILLAFGMTFPEERIFIFPLPIPIKAKWFIMGYIVIELLAVVGSANDGVAHFAHLGGMLFGFLLIRYWQRHPGSDNFDSRSNQSWFENIGKGNWFGKKKRDNDVRHKTDWEYNADKKADEEEIDRILDKIRKNGYASLTKEEKQRLFESSNKR